MTIDRAFGFIRSWAVTSAARHDGAVLRGIITTDNTASDVWADTAYRSKTNEEWLRARGLVSRIHRKKPPRRPMPDNVRRGNATKSKVRSSGASAKPWSVPMPSMPCSRGSTPTSRAWAIWPRPFDFAQDQIVDASIIAAPCQRMSDEARAIVKDGGIPENWAAQPARLAQKDRDARWTLKRGRRKKGPDGKLMAEIATPIFGYKSHIGIDQHHGFILVGQRCRPLRWPGAAGPDRPGQHR